jgi:4a-hydroxytetrahydrobiopterin dehydratase
VGRLSDDEITRRLRGAPAWSRAGDEIVRVAELPSFPAAIEAVGRIADLAEAANHHPDIDIRYRTVRLALTTHDDGGISEKDFELASRIDDVLGSVPS